MSAPVSREVIKKFCLDLGYDPNSVAEILIRPESVTFELYMEPVQQGADGPLTVLATHPVT